MLQIAVIGAGHWGPNLIRNMHNKQTSQVAWIVDQDTERLSQASAHFPDVRITEDVGPALSDPDVDAAVIATPTVTHYALVKAALEAGKHVFVEKPITAHLGQAAELCELAESMGRVLMVGHVFIYNTAVQHVREYIKNGDLGDIYYISMERTNLGPIRVDVNAAWDLASHDISIVNYWLDAQPASVSAIVGSWINPGIEDVVFATLRYPGNVLVNLHASWLNPRKARHITVVGDRRMLTFDDLNLSEPIRIYDKYVSDERTKREFISTFASFRASVRDGDIRIPKVVTCEPLRRECEHFLECITHGRKPITDGYDGMNVVSVLEAIARSAQNAGREEEVAR